MPETTTVALVCTKCGCEIDWCSFCDENDCTGASCYECTVVELHESMPVLHTHGG
jgi:hypothetical protein